MKSAYELIMERLAKESPEVPLSEAQKQELAEISSRYTAKIAERKTFLSDQIKSAERSGDLTAAEQLRTQLRRDLVMLNEEMEAKKAAIRQR